MARTNKIGAFDFSLPQPVPHVSRSLNKTRGGSSFNGRSYARSKTAVWTILSDYVLSGRCRWRMCCCRQLGKNIGLNIWCSETCWQLTNSITSFKCSFNVILLPWTLLDCVVRWCWKGNHPKSEYKSVGGGGIVLSCRLFKTPQISRISELRFSKLAIISVDSW